MLEAADARYTVGLAAALFSAAAINLGLVIQKRAVSGGDGEDLLKRLARDPRWLAGISLQTLIGAPLNVVAVAMAGPASVPGIMALGLIVLAAASAFYAKERLGKRELAGIGIVMCGVLAVAGAGLGVDVLGRSPSEANLLPRTLILAAVIVVCAVASARFAAWREKVCHRPAPALLAAASGSWTALTNLALGVTTSAMASVLGGVAPGGDAPHTDFILLVASILVVFYSSIVAVVITQKAFLSGKATVVVPVQQAPIQAFAPLSFLLVYVPRSPTGFELVLAILGAILAVTGAVFLSRGNRRQEDAGRSR